ncbi:MAG: hypothetical protein KAR44_10660 [Candidatus Aegiribacteria sp.]|nr:hypothetical protein [Candidatus Aegiribacteria sp.]
MLRVLFIIVILLVSFGCGEVTQLEPAEVVEAFLHAQESRDARLMVSYLSDGKLSNMGEYVDEIKNGDPNRILDITRVDISESEIRNLNAETFYILSFEAHWDMLERMNLEDSGPEYLIGEPRITGDTARVEITERYYNSDEINTWVIVREDDRWKIDCYPGP